MLGSTTRRPFLRDQSVRTSSNRENGKLKRTLWQEVRGRAVDLALALRLLPLGVEQLDPDVVRKLLDGDLLTAERRVLLDLLLWPLCCGQE